MPDIQLKDLYGSVNAYDNIKKIRVPNAADPNEYVEYFNQALLQTKDVYYTSNGDATISADSPYVGLSNINVHISVADSGGGGDVLGLIMGTVSGSVTYEGVGTVRDYCFYKCSQVEEMYLPDCIGKIGQKAFYDCSNLTTLSLPIYSSVAYRAPFVFNGCRKLSEFKGGGIYGEYAFAGGSYLSIAYIGCGGDGILDFDNPELCTEMFQSCSSLKRIEFTANGAIVSDAAIKLGYSNAAEGMFYNCSALEEAPNFVISMVGYNAAAACMPNKMFYGCTSLKSVTAYCGMTSNIAGSFNIGSSAFYKCSSMSVATFYLSPVGANNTSSMSLYLGADAFAYCSSLFSLYFKVPNTATGGLTVGSINNAFFATPITSSVGGVYGSVFVPSRFLSKFKQAWSGISNRIVADPTE